jgi:hypothetical protein
MVLPIEGALSLMQIQTALEILQTAQREAAIARIRHESDSDKARDIYQTTVTEHEEVSGKTIRDDDPRESRKRRPEEEDQPAREDQDEPPHVDIIV